MSTTFNNNCCIFTTTTLGENMFEHIKERTTDYYLTEDRYNQIKKNYPKCDQSIPYSDRHLFKRDFYQKYIELDCMEKSDIGYELTAQSECTYKQFKGGK